MRQTWNLGFDKDGHPIGRSQIPGDGDGPGALSRGAATNFEAPSYDNKTGLFYVDYNDAQNFAINAPAVYERGKQYVGRGVGTPPEDTTSDQGIMAIDSKTGKTVWKYHHDGQFEFGGVGRDARRPGFRRHRRKANSSPWMPRPASCCGTSAPAEPITASPISYAVDGQQFVAIAAGNMVYSFALPKQ